MSLLEWHYLMETSVQRHREAASTYILEKTKLFRQCPVPVNDADCIPFLIRGLSSAELRGALSRDVPQTVGELITTIAGMEAYQPTSLAFLSPSNDQRGAPTVPRTDQTQRVMNNHPQAPTDRRAIPYTHHAEETARLVRPSMYPATTTSAPALPPAAFAPRPGAVGPAASAPPGPTSNNALVPAQRPQRRIPRTLEDLQCYGCGYYGHLRRDCPYGQAQGNAPAGPTGQVRR